MAFPYTQTFGDGTPYPVVPAGTSVVNVSTQAGLDAAITAATPGQRIVVAAGSYSTLTVTGKNGTASAGISIVAASAGTAKFSGQAVIKDCSYLTVSGLSWPQDSPGDTFQFRGGSHHCRMIRCTIGPPVHPGVAITTEAGNYVYVGDDCHDLDIGYNELRNKARAGNGVRVYGNFTTFVGCRRVRIHHNDIHDFYPAAVNDFEPIRYGVSTMSRTDAYGVIERNVFTNIRSEPEIVSGKMGALRITGNVAATSSGSFCIRHGRNSILADNYAVDGATTTNTNGERSGGFRFYDSGHLVERNYGAGLAGTNFQDPLIIDSGDTSGTSTNLSGHWQVVGATVAGNVLVNCPFGVTIGNNYALAPSTITVRDNVAVAVTSGQAVTQRITPLSSTVDATNLYYSSAASGGFTQDADGIYRKTGYGPRLTFLTQTGVGPAADLTEIDGTGVVLTTAIPSPSTGTTTGGTTGTNTGSTGGTTTTTTGVVRTLGVNGIPRPTAGANVTLVNSDSTSPLTISTSGTSAAPRIWDGGGHTVGKITINADWVIVQNFRVVANGQYGIYSTGSHVTIANNDISDIHGPGDLNAITMFGDYHHIIYNTAINFISGDPGDSHTDFIQTWDTTSKRPSSNVVIQGNRAETPSRTTTNRVIHQCIMAEGPASTDGGGGGAGPMSNWLVADNYFKGSWNQEIKFDDVDNVEVTRNTFAGDSTKICEVTSLSSGFKFYADNKITGSYPSGAGVSTTAGSGPLGPYPPGSTVPGTGTGGTGGGTAPPPGTVSVSAGPDVSTFGGAQITVAGTETNSTALTITARKWEVVGNPGATDQSTAAGRLGWGTPLPASDEFTTAGGVDSSKWSPRTGAAPGGATWDPQRGSVDGTKLSAVGLTTGQAFGMEHRFGQQYGRWECRMRTYSTGTTSVGGGTGQTLGVGGIAKPAAASNVELNNANRGDMNITASGTAAVPRIYDGGGFTCGRVTISADYIIVQNYNIRPNSQYAVYITGSHVTVQNCDIKNVSVSGDGDLNAITLLEGSDIKIAYNTAINYVSGNPGGSHTDFIQTWVSSSHPTPVNNVQVIGNKAVGPANPSRDNAIPSIHQCIMVESAGRGGNSGGNGTPSNWLVADNEFGDSWGQSIKLDAGNNFVFTRNRWTGSSDRIFAISGSGNVIYSDNVFGSGYGQVGATVTSGNGPGSPAGGGVTPGNYNPILCVTPDSGHNVEDGAYYFSTNGAPGQTVADAQMYFPRTAGATPGFREFTKAGVDWTQFHNIALEWTSTALTGYVDGVQFFTTGGGATANNRDIQTMPSGHLLIAMNPSGTTMTPATMEIDWVRVYSLNPVGVVTGTTGTISTAQTATWTAPLIVGTYVLRYTITLSDGSTRSDDTVVTVSAATPGTFFPYGIASDEAFGATTAFWSGTARPSTLLYPGTSTFPGTTTFPGYSVTSGGGGGATDTPTPGTFSPAGIPSEETFGVSNLFTVGIPPLVFYPPGIASEEDFGATTAFSAGAEPTAAVGGVFVPSLWAVDKLTGAMIPLPKWSKITISRVRHALGAITVDYPQDALGFSTLSASVGANPPKALEIRIWLGGNSTGSLGGWLVAKQTTNKLVTGGVWSFSGHFHEWLMTKAIVGPQPKTTANPNGEMVFAGSTYGSVLLTVIQQAQARRALPYVVCDFTASRDSNGQPWSQVVTNLRFSPKTTVMQVADKGVDLNMIEYCMTGSRVLRAFNFGTRGIDRSVTDPPLVFQNTINLAQYGQRESSRDAGTAVLAAGAEGFYSWGADLSAEASLGWRAEVGADGGNITSQSGVDAYAQVQASIVSKGVAEYTSEITFRPGDLLPMLGYDVGDIAVAVTNTERIPSRIEQIDVSFEPGSAPSGTVAQNNLVVDKLAALYRKLNALQSGDAVVGTSTATPGGSGDDHTPPAAPRGVVVSSNVAYTVPGLTVAASMVTVGWLPVTTNAADADLPLTQAAVLIAARFASNAEIFEDWTWVGAPDVVLDNNEKLLVLFEQTGPGAWPDPRITQSQAWLADYVAAHSSTTETATDDVAGYHVNFAYLQPVVIGGVRNPTFNVADLLWHTPDNSPTTATSITFGGIEAGRAVGIRVSAVDTSGNMGPWSPRVDFTSQNDETPPPVPSAPAVSAWFRTLNITWDGKGSQGEDMIEAAPDFLSGGGVEIHVGQGFNFEPHRPFTAAGVLDLANSTTYVQTLYGAGTWNVPGLALDVTYYARLVSFDRNGNASDPSACSVGVKMEQLVNIDIGPNAIAREQIIDGEIVNAKIANAAVNSLKVEEISAGLISAGTMSAQVAVSGRFYTQPLPSGNRVEFDAAGIRLYRGGTVVGRWQVADASVLATGTYQSGLSGRRINILPSGTMYFYPDAGIDPGFLENNNGDLRMSGQTNLDGRAGFLTIDSTRSALTYAQANDYRHPRSRFQCDPIAAATWAPIISNRILTQYDSDIFGPRWFVLTTDSNGSDIGTSAVHAQMVPAAGNHTVFYGANGNAGVVFDAGFIAIVHNDITPAPIAAQAFNVSSGRTAKTDVRAARLPGGFLATVRGAESQEWRYVSELAPRSDKPGHQLRRRRMIDGVPANDEDGREMFDMVDDEWVYPPERPRVRYGPMADDLPSELHVRHPRTDDLMVSLGDLVGVLWGAVRELDARIDEIARRQNGK